jgi:hypothetical protein
LTKPHSRTAASSDDDVDEKVEGGVEGDEGVRDAVDDVEPVGPLESIL